MVFTKIIKRKILKDEKKSQVTYYLFPSDGSKFVELYQQETYEADSNINNKCLFMFTRDQIKYIELEKWAIEKKGNG